jgi:hypothetical protein
MTTRKLILAALGVALLVLGVMTLVTGGKVIMGVEAAVAAHGDFVPFVVWGNVSLGPLYLIAGAGLLTRRRWAGLLAQGIAIATLLLGFAFGLHILAGGAYEVHTAIALTVRTTVLAVVGTAGHWILRSMRDLGAEASSSGTLIITEDTLVSDILEEYGDIAEVMEAFGVKRAGGLTLRKILGRFITVKRAAKVHGVPLDSFLSMVRQAAGHGAPGEGEGASSQP